MALIGFPITSDGLNNSLGQAVREVRDGLDACRQLQVLINSVGDTMLTTATPAGVGLTTDQLASFKAVLNDMVALADVATAARTQPQANNFFFNANQYGVTGLQ
jgi:hypothetical protein